MIQNNVKKQLDIIEKSKHWIGNSLDGNKAIEAYNRLVYQRRKLNKKKYALEGNPAAAIYGESQVGKSYLISSLLSQDGRPFSIIDENKQVHNFIEKINPPGNGSESTSLVSRFSVNFKPTNPRFPIKAVLLTISDLVLVLCDSFYNDINLKASQNIHLLSTDEINEEVSRWQEKIKKRTDIHKFFTEDDVLDIQDYFNNYFQKADKVIDSKFFSEVSRFITKLNPSEWKDVFSLLWNKNEIYSSIFDKLILEYQKLDFTNEVYLTIQSVLYSHGTLLDVKRLHEIYSTPEGIEPNYKPDTQLLLPKSNAEINFAKSYLCALTAELVFSQSESLVSSKPFLKSTDLLDFPGARSRMEKPLDTIETNTIPDLLLRGKVAYLFNKYSDAEKINILLFCAKHEQTSQRTIPRLLNNWINKVVGENDEIREAFISDSKISPLFVIGTFFNINLAFNPLQDKNDGSGTPLSNRWLQRFKTTMEKEYFETVTYSWFENWTKSQADFQNIFLLRDFEKSETPSNLFRGFNINKKELEEIETPQYPNFRKDLRQSFLDYDFVKRHFANPEESWDSAATINRDGTSLIIEKLTTAADNINSARLTKMTRELNEISQAILSELMKYFHSNDKDEELKKAKNIAGDIQFKLATSFSGDQIKAFGQLMKELMVDEKSVLDLFRKKIEAIEHRDVINMDMYSTFRIEVPVENDDTSEKYFEKLCIRYEKNTPERKEDFRAELEEKKIDLEDLIKGNADLIKNNAKQLAEALIEYWLEYITLNDKITIQEILAQDTSLEKIREMYQKLFKKLAITKRIAEKIRRYVDGNNKTDLPYEIVADISAELLNKFISTVGFEYLDDAEIKSLEQANNQNNLGLILRDNQAPNEQNVIELFSKIENQTEIMSSQPELMKTLPSYRSYLIWSDRLKVGFVSVCEIPNFDISANAKLGEIIDDCASIKF
jgi:hypothetical protein